MAARLRKTTTDRKIIELFSH